MRGYLRDLLHKGYFTIVSPVTGRLLQSGSSLVLADKSVLFSFPEEPTLMLAVGDMSFGYPVCALLLTDLALLLPTIRTDWGFAERHVPLAAAAIQDSGWFPTLATEALTLVLGDTNFAHHTWNQLSALEEFASDAVPAAANFVVTQQPLGPIKDILPWYRDWDFRLVPDTELPLKNGPGKVFSPVGGRFINAALAQRILDYSSTHMSERAREISSSLMRAQGFILWVSVRTRNRTPLNQQQLLDDICGSFLKTYSDGLIVIDGYSLPDDFNSYSAYHRNEGQLVLEADLQAACTLQSSLELQFPGRVHVAVGLTIGDSIALAQHADLYFCHHGTVQHKIGWFTSTPGVVHCNRAMLDAGPAEWVAAQSEVAVQPVYLPSNMVRDRPVTEGVLNNAYAEFSELLHHDNYVVIDVPSVIELVLVCARGVRRTGSTGQSEMGAANSA